MKGFTHCKNMCGATNPPFFFNCLCVVVFFDHNISLKIVSAILGEG